MNFLGACNELSLLFIQARRSFRALKGLVRLQGVVRGQNVKRQTMNAMKYMQLSVRVQSQIQSRRIQMLENQARHQVQNKNDKDVESTFSKWNLSQQVCLHSSVCYSMPICFLWFQTFKLIAIVGGPKTNIRLITNITLCTSTH